MSRSKFGTIVLYKKPEHLPAGWRELEHVKKNLEGEYTYWCYKGVFANMKRKRCSAEEVVQLERDGFARPERTWTTKIDYRLWINTCGEVYTFGTGDPYITLTEKKREPLVALALPPAPDEYYSIPGRCFGNQSGLGEYRVLGAQIEDANAF